MVTRLKDHWTTKLRERKSSNVTVCCGESTTSFGGQTHIKLQTICGWSTIFDYREVAKPVDWRECETRSRSSVWPCRDVTQGLRAA